MSKMDGLIQQYCPNGVEYYRFDEVCSLHARIGWQRLTKSEHRSEGEYMLITGTDFTVTHEVNYGSCVYVGKDRYEQDKKLQLKNGDILVTKDGTLGKIAQVNGLTKPATLNGGVFVVRPIGDNLKDRFILHYLLSGHFTSAVHSRKTGSTISHLTQGLFSQLLIPVPPLPVQDEIVRILDRYVELENQVEAELKTELEMRRKQYEYYSDVLLCSNSDELPLSKICQIVDCPHSSPKWKDSGIPVIRNYNLVNGHIDMTRMSYVTEEEYRTRIRRIEPMTNDILFSREAPIGNVGIIPQGLKCCQGQRIVLLRPYTDIILPQYLLLALQGRSVKQQIQSVERVGATVSNFNLGELKNLMVSVPSLDAQRIIIERLSRYKSLFEEINESLPAEIMMRHQQYEYYRDKLLTFKRLEVA